MELEISEAFILAIGALGLGMIMLIRGGGWTIDGAVYIARHMGISPLVVGFTIVAFGTSLPELLVSVGANLHGAPGIAIGNVLGSNIANILFVIGATALIGTIPAVPRTLIRDLFMMLLATLFFAGLALTDSLTRPFGFLMILILLLYVLWQYKLAKQGEIAVEEVKEAEFSSMRNAALFLISGLVFIALGAEFLIRGAKVSAIIAGVPEGVIGLSVIAIGTSLPELSTCLIAARKKHSDIILGNIIGSNVFNILMILGATIVAKSIPVASVAPRLLSTDIWLAFSVSLVFTLLLIIYRKVTPFLGILFLGGYVVYIAALYVFSLSGTH